MKDDDIEKFRKDLAIIRETAAQVLKDFQLAGFDIKFSGNEYQAYDELKSQLIPVLSGLFHEQPNNFQNLLYRIDVNEKQLNEIIKSGDQSGIAEKIAGLILQREFQKVITRKYFSGDQTT